MSEAGGIPTIRPAAAPLPELDTFAAFYWTSGREGLLRIQRCQSCRYWRHPPSVRCSACGSSELAPETVSGEGVVATFAVNHQPWVQGMEVPFVIAVIELDEQRGLYVTSNLGGAPDDVRIGMRVRVTFEQVDDVWFPVFSPRPT